MNENDKTEILEPVETPAENITEPSKDGSRRPKWLPPLVAAVCAVILVAAGIIGWNAYSGAKLAEAKEACATAADTVRNNANEYNALLNGDAADAAAVKAEQVKDSKTVESLGKELKASAPEYEGCVAENAQGLDAATVKLNEQADWYETHEKSLTKAVRAVAESKAAKRLDDAKNESDGEAGRGVEAACGFGRQGRGQRHPRRIVERHRRGERAEGRERSGEDRRSAQNAGGCHQRRERERPGKDGRGCAAAAAGRSRRPGIAQAQPPTAASPPTPEARTGARKAPLPAPTHTVAPHRAAPAPARRRPKAEPQRRLRLRQQLHRQG